MKKQVTYVLASFLLLGAVLTGCKKDDKAPENEEELITTVKLTFIEVGNSSNTTTFTFKDADGPGGAAPSLNQQINLSPNKQYNCTISVLDESKTPTEDITAEIIAEANDHQFYFAPNGVNITINGLNNDPLGRPLGVTSVWTTGAAGAAGTVKVTLKHKPGAKGSNDAVTVGETDIEIDFAARVQ